LLSGTQSRYTAISISSPSPIITHQINNWYCLLWCTGPDLCDEDSLQAELVFVMDVFKQSGYNRQIHRALNRRPHLGQPDSKPNSVALLPFVRTIFNRMSRVPAQHNTKSVGLHHMKFSSLPCSSKDNLGLRTPSGYRTPFVCGRVYTGQKSHSVDIRLWIINGTSE
jgi:hypothetical protein